MELRHLRYFVAVAEELHFGRAAARLHIAQPPLSRQIRDLEREVGTPLFERVARGVALTAAGRAFLPEARLTLAQAARAQRTAERAARGEIGRLRVGFVEAATYARVLPEVLGFFRMHLPNIGISLFEMDAQAQADAFRDGRIDLGLLHSVPADADRLLHVETVYTEAMIAAVPGTHRLASQTRVALGAFAEESFVLFPRTGAPPASTRASCRRRRRGTRWRASLAQAWDSRSCRGHSRASRVPGWSTAPFARCPSGWKCRRCGRAATNRRCASASSPPCGRLPERGLILRNCPVLRHDVRANEIRVMEQRFVRGALEETSEEHGQERIACADGVSHFDLESRMLGPSPVAPECGAVATARDADGAAMEGL